MWRKFFFACFLLASSAAFGQFVQITGTAQDNIGLPYANGTIVAVLNISGSPTINGQPYTPPQGAFGLDINGKFSFNLAANNQLSPSGSTWSFIVCSGTGTVSIAWGRQSACFNVSALTLNSSQDITAQLITNAQPLTYSASFLAAASPTCPLLDGLVDLDFTHQDLAHRASVQAAVLNSQVAVGFAVYVPQSQCLGVTQVATGLVVPCKTDNQSTIGDFVTSSSSARGECDDYGNTLSNTTRTYGQVIQANNGSGTISMILVSAGGGSGGGGGGSVGNCPVAGAIGWYQVAGTVIGCNVNLTADSLGNLTALGYFLNGTGTLEIQSTTYSGGLPAVCAALGTCLSFDTNGILNGSVNGGAWFSYLNTLQGILWDMITDRDTTGVTDFSRFFDLLTNINCAQPFVCVGGGAANSGVVNSSTMTDDLTSPVASPDGLNARTQGYYGVEIPANATTGVGQFLTGCDDGAGALLICSHLTSTTNVPAGIVEACNDGNAPPNAQPCGTTGHAIASGYGFLTVKFDNTATALHYAQQSSSVDGELSDVGATAPTNGQPYYFIWVGNSGPGTAGVIRILTGDELLAARTGGSGTDVQINGTNTEKIANFVNSASLTWQTTNSGNTTTVTPIVIAGSPASTYRTCQLVYGADNGSGLANADLGPQGAQCLLPYNATVVEIDVDADAGTPSVIVADNHNGTITNLTSSALSTGVAGAQACSNTTGGLGFNPLITCSATLQNTSIAQGDYLVAVSGTASSAHRLSISITFTQPNFTSGGTVTSVGLIGPTGFQVSGSPVLTAGSLTFAMPSGWTTGDLLLGNGSNSVSRLIIGSNNTVLTSNGTTASWQAAGSSGNLFQYECPNNGAGTVVNTLTKTAGSACQQIGAGSSFNLTWFAGITISGAGTTGNALIQHHGQASCVFDNGITQGDYFTWSGSTAGNCHDMGNRTAVWGASPALGTVVSATNASAGTYTVDIDLPSGADITNGGASENFPLHGPNSPADLPSALSQSSLMTGGVIYASEPSCVLNSNSNYSCMKIDSTGDLIFTPNGGASDSNNPPQSAHVMINSGLYTAVDSQGTVSSGTITFDMSAGMIHSVTAGANITVANPTHLVAGQIFILQLCENATGSFTWSFGNEFINPPTPSTTASSCSAPHAPTNFVMYAIDTSHIYTASSF